jgi:sodium/potassium/calcium exchanger 6
VLIYLIFRFISATVDEYIAGGITVISEYLGMSESMAAVTLLAFANGAGEMITAIVSCTIYTHTYISLSLSLFLKI